MPDDADFQLPRYSKFVLPNEQKIYDACRELLA